MRWKTQVWDVYRESGSTVSEGLDESPQRADGVLVPRTGVGLLNGDTHGLEAHSGLGRREEEQGAAVGAKETVSFSVTVGIGTPPIGRGCVQGETGGEGRGQCSP